MFPDEPIDPTVIISPLKNKNQLYRKVIYLLFITLMPNMKQDLSSRVGNVKSKTNTTETQHS